MKKMKKLIFLFGVWLVLLSGTSIPQGGINFAPKQLNKELSKIFNSFELQLIEIKTNKISSLEGKYFMIQNKEITIGYLYIGRVESCRTGVCIAPEAGVKSISEYFDYFMIFDSIPKIKCVKVFNYAASHGQEVTAKGWLKQFIGYSGDSKLTVGKNVDAISGATVSVAGIVSDIEIKTNLLQTSVNGQLTTD
jgi:hypothetical protein